MAEDAALAFALAASLADYEGNERIKEEALVKQPSGDYHPGDYQGQEELVGLGLLAANPVQAIEVNPKPSLYESAWRQEEEPSSSSSPSLMGFKAMERSEPVGLVSPTSVAAPTSRAAPALVALLESLGLAAHLSRFLEEEIEDVETIKLLTTNDLRSHFGLTLGAAHRLLHAARVATNQDDHTTNGLSRLLKNMV